MLVAKCDACGKMIDEGEAHTLGVALKREYCHDCAEQVTEFRESLDALHTAASEQWEKDVLALSRSFYTRFPNGKLPDRT